MQKMRTVKWRTRAPFGDKLFYRPRFVFGTTMTIASGSSFVAANFQMKSMPALNAYAGDAPGVTDMGAQFLRYRIRGLKVKYTYWPDATAPPMVGFVNACSAASQLPPSPAINVLPEQRWSRYSTLTVPANGAKPTVIRQYYSVNKVYGPDQIVKNDVDFTAITSTSGPAFWSAPAVGPVFQYGLMTMSGLNATAALNVVAKVEITPYIEVFSRRLDIT